MEIVTIGNALVDIIARVEDELVHSFGIDTNSSMHISSERLADIIPLLPNPWICAGGGAANTARAARLLGLDACFVGAVGQDPMGELYAADLTSTGVDVRLSRSKLKTGIFCALVGTEGQRTILVAPGAAPSIADLEPDYPRNQGAIFYMDGFLISNTDFFLAEASKAKQAGMSIAIDLGSRAFVKGLKSFLLEIIPRFCDFVFANEDEFLELLEVPLREACVRSGALGSGFIVKKGERGALFTRKGLIWESPVRALAPFDVTGAGDAFAAGFLAGLSRGLSPVRSLRLGNRIAEEALAVPGLRLDPARVLQAGQSVAK